MSGGANQSFLSNPRRFLANNALVVDIQRTVQTGQLHPTSGVPMLGAKFDQGQIITLNIQKDPTSQARKENGGSAIAYKITEATGTASSRSHRFSAYYLPFFNNDYRTMNLGNAADIFITDTMNGCSFACSGAHAAPRVGHFNRTSGPNDVIDQTAIDHDIGMRMGGVVTKSLKKAGYKNDPSEKVTMIGIREHGQWVFLWQKYRIGGMTKMGTLWEIDANSPQVL